MSKPKRVGNPVKHHDAVARVEQLREVTAVIRWLRLSAAAITLVTLALLMVGDFAAASGSATLLAGVSVTLVRVIARR